MAMHLGEISVYTIMLIGKWLSIAFLCYMVWCTLRWTKILFRIPHMPPAGSLKVLHAPARWGEIRRASQTKIYNLETGE